MRHLKPIPVKEAGHFLARQMRSEPPLFWGLVLPEEGGARSEEVGRARRRPDSGTLEITFPLDAGFAFERDDKMFVQEFEGLVRRYAEAEDERDFPVTEGPLPAGVGFELESRVRVTEGKGPLLRVIGPGGRATAFRGARGMTGADVTIRRRSRAERGVWRRLPQILRPLEQALGEEFMGAEEEPTLRAAFGYFELSKYEAQSLMRPVFLFAIEHEQDPDGRWPGYQRIVVSAATTAAKLDESEGLGTWAENTVCSG
jgi:hypothetical protein